MSWLFSVHLPAGGRVAHVSGPGRECGSAGVELQAAGVRAGARDGDHSTTERRINHSAREVLQAEDDDFQAEIKVSLL